MSDTARKAQGLMRGMKDIEMPAISIPRPRLGEVSVMDVQVPDITLPRPKLGEVTVRDVQLPDVTLPRPRMGEVTIQDVQLPDVTVPRPRMGAVWFKDVPVPAPNVGRPMRGLSRMVRFAALAFVGMALYKEMSRPEAERTWHGDVMGVPYDFRPPTSQRFREAWWNDQAGLFTPTPWGMGWTLNFHRGMSMLMKARSGQ